MPKLIDLTNQMFKNWKVIQKSDSRNGKVYWLCECQKCHKQKKIQGTHLKNNTFSNCCDEEFLKEKRICIICGSLFYPKKGGYTRKYCYQCSPEEKNRGSAITSLRHAIKHQLILYKGGKCQRCGYNKCEGALHFHHIDSQTKDFEISNMYNNSIYSMELLYKEVDKCELLCANCHAEEHFKNNNEL